MERFEVWLAESGIGVAVKRFPEGTRTAMDAAKAVGCEVEQIVKSLVFVAAQSVSLITSPHHPQPFLRLGSKPA